MKEAVYERAAVAKARELGLLQNARFAGDVLAARDLGKRMDAAQPSPSFRLASAYQSALAALERRGAALARETSAAPTIGGEKVARLREMRHRSTALHERTAAGLPAFDTAKFPLLLPPDDEPPTDTAVGTEPGTAIGTGTARAGTEQGDDVAALVRLDPPPRSRRDVMERLGWGTTRAAAALRTYREEMNRAD